MAVAAVFSINEPLCWLQAERVRTRSLQRPQMARKRTEPTTSLIAGHLTGIKRAIANRVQIATDRFKPYSTAVETAFGWAGADFGQLVTIYATTVGTEDTYQIRRRWSMS